MFATLLSPDKEKRLDREYPLISNSLQTRGWMLILLLASLQAHGIQSEW
jgi:hypothetical protein